MQPCLMSSFMARKPGSCARERVDDGGAIWPSFTGAPLDAWLSAFVLAALEPAALEGSLEVAADVEAQRQRLHQHWAQRLERANSSVIGPRRPGPISAALAMMWNTSNGRSSHAPEAAVKETVAFHRFPSAF